MLEKQAMIERFVEYVKIDTQSDVNSDTFPSTLKQMDILNVIKAEMDELGIKNKIVETGTLYIHLASNVDKDVPKIGFIAHIDTAGDLTGKNVKPQIIENYDGGVIKLNDEFNLDPNEFSSLNSYVNQTLITTDGTTLLGADDKAGIAEILQVVKHLHLNPEIKHGQISVAFGPDEEIGRGTVNFDVDYFDADFAYTIDGGKIGELQYESFNAYNTVVTIKGKNVHPGNAKNIMINSQEIAIALDNMLPKLRRPQYTEKYEGFFHLHAISGNEDETKMTYLIRDHDTVIFETMKNYFFKVIEQLKNDFPGCEIIEDGKDVYHNMGIKVMEVPMALEYAKRAMQKADIEPIVEPIRGGTDGSSLSFMGLPCPNIFTGAHNLHGRFEYVVVESMLKASEVIFNITQEVLKD